MTVEEIRLNKYLSEAGIASRRGADALIADGRVSVNGVVATAGMKVSHSDTVSVDGNPVSARKEQILVAFHKPRGVVCTAEEREPDNVYQYFHYPKRLKYIGRLDKESEGLLLFTDDGDLANDIAKAGNFHEKEYIVRVNKPVTKAFLKQMSEGLTIEIDGKLYDTRPCVVKKMDSHVFSIVLTQGFNRQIRRMCKVCGYHVVSLKRIRVMNISLGTLKSGRWRLVTPEERDSLFSVLEQSKNQA